jgi:glycosyltransferase involved in cell wall biosynthesis
MGGSTISLLSLIEGLKEYKDLNVTVLLPLKRGTALHLFEKNNIKCKEILYRHNFKKINEKYSVKHIIFDIINTFAVMRLCMYIQKEKFDIVCSNSTAVDVGARASNILKIPHIYYIREFMEVDHNIEYRDKKCMKRLLENSAYVIFVSKIIEEYYSGKYSFVDSKQFYDGINFKNYYVENNHILKDVNISFVQIGKFQDGKGTLNTIKLLYKLYCGGFKNWNMEFVGTGKRKYIDQMKKLISEYKLDNYIKVGEFCNNIKEKLLQKDILIMNSKDEAFGRVTVEGMMSGCLVMGRYGGGTNEIIDNEMHGVIFESDNDFVEKIFQINCEREKYRNVAEESQKYALEKFKCESAAKNFVNVLNNIFMTSKI